MIWRVAEYLDPWGQLRDDYRIAKLVASIANLIIGRKSDGQSFEAKDFLLEFKLNDPLPRQQSVEEIERHMVTWVMAAKQKFKEQAAGRR